MEISEIINRIERGEDCKKVIRCFKYELKNMQNALNAILAIGKARNSNFVIDHENRWVLEQLIKWIHADDTFECQKIDKPSERIKGRLNAGIYIAGNTGTGKSWLAEIISIYSEIDDVKLRFGNVVDKIKFDCVRTDNICEEYARTGIIDIYKNKRIICFQDLGDEESESMYMGNRVPVMRSILSSRGDRQDLITIITSNLPINHELFIKKYDVRVKSRLHEMCNYFELKGKDRRIK